MLESDFVMMRSGLHSPHLPDAQVVRPIEQTTLLSTTWWTEPHSASAPSVLQAHPTSGFASLQPPEGVWMTAAEPPGAGRSSVEHATIPPATIRVMSPKMRFEREEPTIRTLRDFTNFYKEISVTR